MNWAAIGAVVTFWIVIVGVVWLSQTAAAALLIAIGSLAILMVTGGVYRIASAMLGR